ncbi:DoxX family protein [Ammonicoccus fulvus]|uniref:DoxX family protein n=1 Tax=Ammonicoccus fulvus TaxID=3138240 RepID=A0ABZ3FPC8_9ACTN
MSVHETLPRSSAENDDTQAMDPVEVHDPLDPPTESRRTLPRPTLADLPVTAEEEHEKPVRRGLFRRAEAEQAADIARPAAEAAAETKQPTKKTKDEDVSRTEEISRIEQPDADTEETRLDIPVVRAGSSSAAPAIEDEETPPTPEELRAQRRAERDKALGTRRRPVEPEPEVEKNEPRFKRTTDKFLGSFGLFLLRIVAGGIIGLHGFAHALDNAAVQTMLAGTIIPEPVIMSYVLTGAEVAIALALVFGLFTRLAGLGMALIGIGALVYVHWVTNPFRGNTLVGELELLLAAIGLLFVCLGGGGWSVDAAFRRRRSAEA